MKGSFVAEDIHLPHVYVDRVIQGHNYNIPTEMIDDSPSEADCEEGGGARGGVSWTGGQ